LSLRVALRGDEYDVRLVSHLGDHGALSQVYQRLSAVVPLPAQLRVGANTVAVRTYGEALRTVLDLAQRGYDVQRYKGLGEMNPDQLWETTMNPEVRTLQKVEFDDLVAADTMFTTLMGDAVEPRRKFIDDNALQVRNLDI
jgi:DNA gyrase subunit B